MKVKYRNYGREKKKRRTKNTTEGKRIIITERLEKTNERNNK